MLDLNMFYCFNIYMYKQKGPATSSSNMEMLRNGFYISDIHRSMSAMGPTQS